MKPMRQRATVRRLAIAGVVFALLAAVFEVYASSSGVGLRFVGQTEGQQTQCHQDVVVVVHGWLEKGSDRWGQYCAEAIAAKADPQKWSCAYYEWSKGAITLNPRDAAQYARDKGGKDLAAELLSQRRDYRHIHLIGHSSGAWLVSEAGKILAKETTAEIHVTFLDAYVPLGWDESNLGDIEAAGRVRWADHYFTRDLTLGVTERKLTHAVNVDITALDRPLGDHNFPKYWYYATISGKYPEHHLLPAGGAAVSDSNGVQYGFARSLEAGESNWLASLDITPGNGEVVRIRK
jgi:hypothetical protein